MTNSSRTKEFSIYLAALFLIAPAVYPQNSSGPEPVSLPPPITAPVDKPYPGTIGLMVDLTDVQHRVLKIDETIPAKPGEVTLLYPEWIPGNHSPTGPISKVSGLSIKANGKTLAWTRDRVAVYAFHVNMPADAKSLDVEFQFLPPLQSAEGRVSMSSNMADLAWNTVILYPAGYFARRIEVEPSLRLPAGWLFASALETASQSDNLTHFKPVPLNTLVDSPLYAGLNFKRMDVSTDSENHVFLDVFADKPADLAITPEELDRHRKMVSEAAKLFRSRHYSHYDFLFLLSDTVGGIGLEHHQSSEDGTKANYFTDWEAGVAGRDLLAHEYTHSWNGKFRRPADLWTPNFNVPMQDDLLWIYEGLTQYYGYVLTARSGLRTPEQTRDLIAQVAANFDISPGRKWRPLVDTTNQPTVSQRSPVSWVSWQRPEDYYTEGMLIWLDADTKIRELSGGKKSLDDFARLFFGIDNRSYVTRTYTLEDVVNALTEVQPWDWAAFVNSRVRQVNLNTPKDGITNGGYSLSFSDSIPQWLKHGEDKAQAISFSTSLGFSVKTNGELQAVWWDSPAFKAGITSDMHLMAVNNQTYTKDALRGALILAEKTKEPIKLLMKRGDQFQSFDLNYHEGLRYPTLKRAEGTPDRLDEILAASK